MRRYERLMTVQAGGNGKCDPDTDDKDGKIEDEQILAQNSGVGIKADNNPEHTAEYAKVSAIEEGKRLGTDADPVPDGDQKKWEEQQFQMFPGGFVDGTE